MRRKVGVDVRQQRLEFAAHEGDHGGESDGRRTANAGRRIIGQRPFPRDKPREPRDDAKHATREQEPKPNRECCFLSAPSCFRFIRKLYLAAASGR